MNPGDNEHQTEKTPRVIGGYNKESLEKAVAIYSKIISVPLVQISNLDATELVKLVENTQRDLNIAYVNEIALICENIGVDAREVLAGCKTKWNWYNALPGPGVGGHCLPNNPYYILKRARECNFEPKLMLLGRQVNDSMMLHTVEMCMDALKEKGMNIKGAKIAVLGAAYKANLDDVRQAPSRVVVPRLVELGADVIIHDPKVNEVNLKKVHTKTTSTLKEALKADCVIFLCAHDEYRVITPRDLKGKIVIDAVWLFDKIENTTYRRIGLSIKTVK